MSNNVPHKVRKTAVMTEDIHTHLQAKCELSHGSVIELHIFPIQQQKNYIDFGIFATAYAVDILYGENVEN